MLPVFDRSKVVLEKVLKTYHIRQTHRTSHPSAFFFSRHHSNCYNNYTSHFNIKVVPTGWKYFQKNYSKYYSLEPRLLEKITGIQTRYFSAVPATKLKMDDKPFQRLPKSVVPINYDLTITPNLVDFTFKGSQAIDVTINEDVSEIVMHAVDLTVGNGVWTDNASGVAQKVASMEYDAPLETVTFKFGQMIPKGSAGTLKMEFEGTINDKMKGFYRSKFKGPNGEERHNAVTQFEATDARRCFPCWDEPAVKATFDIGLVVEKDKVSLSNMTVKSTTPVPGNDALQMIQFERTPIMSTYLVAIVIGDFEFIEKKSADGVLCRVYTPVGKTDQGRFALDVVARVLPYYKEYFGIAYPLPKIDLVAIADFSAGGIYLS